ncbi:MAG TPA: hypothetical protein VGE21_09205 [Flavobacteriales bacterium]
MRKDIEQPKVEGVAMAIVLQTDEEGAPAWYVYLVNTTDRLLENVLVSSRGYGEIDGEQRNTSEMRHHLPTLDPRSWARIERIVEDVFPLSNQYWVSFYIEGALYDRKYIFLPESILEENFTTIPLMNERGVMIG